MATTGSGGGQTLAERIDAIEAAYEFMLAYAAQGVRREEEARGSSIREFLTRAEKAMDGLIGMSADSVGPAGKLYAEFLEVVKRDAAASRAAIRLVLAQPAISSQLIDNLNGSIHLRALLTDLFIVDECLKGSAG